MTVERAFHKPAGPYFLSHSVGLQPTTAGAALERSFMEPWRAGDPDVWTAWLAAIDGFRKHLAPIIGAEAQDICPQSNISGGLTKALFSLIPNASRRKILLARADFPTIGFVLKQAERFGGELEFVEGAAELADPDHWRRRLSADIGVVHVTHVYSNIGVRSPVGEIVRAAREAGAATVVDCAQSAGATPVDLRGWDADFATGTSVKYLCGGPGAAWLWVNPKTVKQRRPIDVGWFSHADPFAFDIEDFRYAPDARRFWGGTPSPGPYVLAAEGARVIGDIGVDAVWKHNQGLVDAFLEALADARFLSHVRAGERGCGLIVRVGNIDAASAALSAKGIAHDRRAGGVRLSFHVYNTPGEVEALADALRPYV